MRRFTSDLTLTSTRGSKIEEKIDKMEENIVNGILQRQEELMTLINSMAQKPTSTEASARE